MIDILDTADKVLSDPMNPPFDSADELLEYLDGILSMYGELKEYPVVNIETRGRVLFVGDLHGDLLSAARVFSYLVKDAGDLSESGETLPTAVFLGDYIDRAPDDIPNGGFLTALFVLSFKLLFPRQVILLRGNHEAYDLMSFSPHELPDEIRDLFGEKRTSAIYSRMLAVFGYMPLFARCGDVIASHASFPREGRPPGKMNEREDVLRTLWGDPEGSKTFRGPVSVKTRFSRDELESFLQSSASNVLVRGHDQSIKGKPMFEGKTVTSLTSRRYEAHGDHGVFILSLEPGREINSVFDLDVISFEDDEPVKREWR